MHYFYSHAAVSKDSQSCHLVNLRCEQKEKKFYLFRINCNPCVNGGGSSDGRGEKKLTRDLRMRLLREIFRTVPWSQRWSQLFVLRKTGRSFLFLVERLSGKIMARWPVTAF